MSDLGDIGNILDSKPRANLDWLEVDEEEYRALDTLPQQPNDALPELEAQWGKLTDADQYRLSQENQLPQKSTISYGENRTLPGEIVGAAAVKVVEKFAKRYLHAGIKGADLLEILKSNFDSDVLSQSKETLRSVLGERGLLGYVYIDSALFEDCHKGAPVKGLTPNTKSAKYVLDKIQCTDCIHNKNGRCSVFQKELTSEVPYDEALWAFYEDRLRAEGKDLEPLLHLPVKERLQKAILSAPKAKVAALDGKPIVADPTANISYEEALAQLRSADIKQEIVDNLRIKQKQKRIAQEMMRGNHSPHIRDLLASDLALAPLRDELYILGNLHLDLSYFPTYKEASSFIDSLDSVPPMIVGIPFEEKALNSKYAQAPSLVIRSPEVLKYAISRYLVVKTGHEMNAKKKAQGDKLFALLRKTSESRVRDFIQKVYQSPVSDKAREYVATVIYDPTEGMSAEDADKWLRAASSRRREVIQNPQEVANYKDVVGRMLRGDHGDRVATSLKRHEHLSNLRPHLHLLGNLYVDTKLASPSEVEAASSANPSVSNLPLLTPNNRDSFFSKPEVHARIAERVAKVKGIEGSEKANLIRNLVTKLATTPQTKIKALAQQAFATPVKEVVAIHNTPYRINPEMKVTEDDVREFMVAIASKKQSRAFNVLADYLQEEGGPELLETLQNRIGLDTIKRVYLAGSGKVASNLKASTTAKQDAIEILSAVLSEHYKPSGIKPPTKRMSNTKVGKFLRDQLMRGSQGKDLIAALKNAFSFSELLDQAPVIIAYREEEGLYGRAYSTADSYDSCHEGAQKVSPSVQQIVKASKCNGCIYNKIGRCLLYGKSLVTSPNYSEDSVQAALNYRIARNQLTDKDAQSVMQMNTDAKTKTRVAHTMSSSLEHTSEGGESGLDQMREFELGSVKADVSDFEFHSGPEPTMDVEFGDGFTIE